jgi:hypothetical protein
VLLLIATQVFVYFWSDIVDVDAQAFPAYESVNVGTAIVHVTQAQYTTTRQRVITHEIFLYLLTIYQTDNGRT